MSDDPVRSRTFTLAGGPADGARFTLATCGHGGWPDLLLTPRGSTSVEFHYRFDTATGTYVHVGQSETFDGDDGSE